MIFPTGDLTTDQVAGGTIFNFYTIVGMIATVQRATGVGTDVVALNVVVRIDLDAFNVIRDHIPGRGRCATNGRLLPPL